MFLKILKYLLIAGLNGNKPHIFFMTSSGHKKIMMLEKLFKRLIKGIEFSISSDQDILNQSVVEVLHGKVTLGQEELCNTLYHLRMRTIEKGLKCKTCSMDYTRCKGQFGHIMLVVPVVNPICLNG